MKLRAAIEKLGPDQAIELARRAATELGITWNDGVCFVFRILAENPNRAPANLGNARDNEYAVIQKWMKRYKGGVDGRASQRCSQLSRTVADPMIERIIGARLNHLRDTDLSAITYAHRLGMSAENILGLILEEYLSVNLKGYGWHCAWGESVKSVDFVHERGALLQIKNRSNSENSSSSAIRNGTTILKWYRIKADRVKYMWESLNELCGTTHLHEESFVAFARKTIKDNPSCLALESKNPWGHKR